MGINVGAILRKPLVVVLPSVRTDTLARRSRRRVDPSFFFRGGNIFGKGVRITMIKDDNCVL